MTQEPKSYSEMKAHYLAVRKRLGGLGPSAGLVPLSAVCRPQPAKETVAQEPTEIEVRPIPERPEIKWTVKGMPKNRLFHILIETAKKYNVDPNLIIEPNRKKQMVEIRREVVWRAIHEAKYSRAKLGRLLKRDHTTIIHDLNCWERDHVVSA